jgi:ABC-2 type transport system permease protein
MAFAGWGDIGFGVLSLAVAAHLGSIQLGGALALSLVGVAVAVAYVTLVGSLAFFMGNAQAAAFQARDSLVNFSLYPSPVFRGWTRVLLMTLVPAAFISHVPIELLRHFDTVWLTTLLAFAAGLWLLTLWVFRRGLRRYESGNLIVLRA